MSSLTAGLLSISSSLLSRSSSPPLVSWPCCHTVPEPISFLNDGRRTSLRVYASYSASGSDIPNSYGDFKVSNGTWRSRKEILLEYVKNVQPEFMEVFVKRAPQQVVDAMRQTVTSMIGALPPQFFAVTVTTVAENLAQLMYSVMMTGYMFKNAQSRLELQRSLEQVPSLPARRDDDGGAAYEPGTQKKVSGEVIRWSKGSGPERIDAGRYIELLESEIEELNRRVSRRAFLIDQHNDLLDYLKLLEPQNLKELTSSAGEDVVLAMDTFIRRRLLEVSESTQVKTNVTETSAPELGKLLYWLMVVGYSIRNLEIRFDMERVLATTPDLIGLPPASSPEHT